jgi:hypothetical protein
MTNKAWLLLAVSLLGACSSNSNLSRPQTAKSTVKLDKPYVPSSRNPAQPGRSTSGTSPIGLEAVMGRDKATLEWLFGPARLNIAEPVGRKLQFVGKTCILDTYLYPEGKNGAEIVTYVDARRIDGSDTDKAQCVNSLSRR